MPNFFRAGRHQAHTAAALMAVATMATSQWALADSSCATITAPALELGAVDCAQVWPQLQASGQFPDVFAGAGKMTPICYKATGPAAASIGNMPVTILSTLSGWTTDFTPFLFGGTDNLGTVVTQLTIADLHGKSTAKLFTRDTIDLSQISTGAAPEEDVIVGGAAYLTNAKGSYRMESAPEDPNAAKVMLTNLHGVLCVGK